MTETILVGVEGTEPSRSALQWALSRATTIGSEVVLVHVVDEGWTTVGSRLLEGVRTDARHLLESEAERARSLAPNVAVSTRLLYGSPMDQLIAASTTASLVVVGTHKTGFIHGKVFGSRSLLLAAAAHTPVAVIPQSSQRRAEGVVVGVDASDAGRAAIRFAAAEAQRSHQILTFVRASRAPSPGKEPDEVRLQRDQYFEEHAAAMLSEATVLAELVDTEIRVRHVRRPAAEALLEASASAALLVVGSSRDEGGGELALGSVAHDVLINLTGPTIVVPGRSQPVPLNAEESMAAVAAFR